MRYAEYLRSRAQDCIELARTSRSNQVAELLSELADSYEDWARDLEREKLPGTRH